MIIKIQKNHWVTKNRVIKIQGEKSHIKIQKGFILPIILYKRGHM